MAIMCLLLLNIITIRFLVFLPCITMCLQYQLATTAIILRVIMDTKHLLNLLSLPRLSLLNLLSLLSPLANMIAAILSPVTTLIT